MPAIWRRHRIGKDSPVTLRLPYRPPYDWTAMLMFLQARAIPGVEAIVANRYARTIELDGVHGSVEIAPGRGHALQASIYFPVASAVPAIAARVRQWFDLDIDPRPIAAHLGADACLAALIAARPGLRVPGAWDGFELAVRAVLGQQITVAAARGLAGRLVAAHGQRLASAAGTGVHGLTHVFPTAANLAAADLSGLGVPRSRAETLARLAAVSVSEPDLLTPEHDTAEALTRLRAVRGLGPWTVDYIAMRALRDRDAFPAGDAGLQRALATGGGHRATAPQALARAERWRPWRAYAAQHLWTALALRADRSAM